MEKLDTFSEGMNMRAGAHISYHIKHMRKPIFMLIGNSGDDYITLIIETLFIHLTKKQAIELHEVMEKSLFGETYKELEEKLFDAEAKVDELEERLSYYED